MNEKDSTEKIINYIKSDLGFSDENIRQEFQISGSIRVIDIGVFVYGKIKIIFEIKEDFLFVSNKEIDNFLVACDILNAEYIVLTNGEIYDCYKSSTKKRVGSIPDITYFLHDISTIHSRVLQYLLKKKKTDKTLRFRLRQQNNNERLDKGYWFLGNEYYSSISFWQGNDWKNKTPNISLVIGLQDMKLELSGKDSDKKAKFLNKLGTVINGFHQHKVKGETRNMWRKYYMTSAEKDYLKVLEDFLETDKQIIDIFLQNEISIQKNKLDIGFYEEKEFQKMLKRINKYRKKQIPITLEPLPVEREKAILPAQLSLRNIGHFKNLNLDLNHRIVCLFGENGIGKSTVLSAIVLGLIGTDETSEVDTSHPRLQQMLRIIDEKQGQIQYAAAGSITLEYMIDKSFTNVITFENDPNHHEVKIFDDSLDFENTFGATFDKNYFKSLVLGFSQVQTRKKSDLGNKNQFENIKKAHVKDILPLLYDREDSRFTELSDWIIGLHGDSLKPDENKGKKAALDVVFSVIAQIIGMPINLIKVNHVDKHIWVKVSENDPILFDLLSQGFKNVFAWIGHFIKRLAESNDYSTDFAQRPALVIIDEIDTYLHPKWQKDILNVLVEKFEKVRFIVTTHSPLVANYIREEDKIIYIIEKNNVKKVENIFGRDIKSIYWEWMGIEERPQEMIDELGKLYDLIDEDTEQSMNEARQLLSELKNTLGENDGDIIQAETQLTLSDF